MDSSTAGWFSSSSPSSSSSSFFFFFFKRRVPTREKPSVTHTLQPSTGRIMSLTGIRLRVSVCLSICLSFTLPINKCHLPATPPFFPPSPPLWNQWLCSPYSNGPEVLTPYHSSLLLLLSNLDTIIPNDSRLLSPSPSLPPFNR